MDNDCEMSSNEECGRPVPEVELDLGCYKLHHNGRRVKLEKKPMELLIFLVAGREQLTSRKDKEIVTKPRRSDLFVDPERTSTTSFEKSVLHLVTTPSRVRGERYESHYR